MAMERMMTKAPAVVVQRVLAFDRVRFWRRRSQNHDSVYG